MDIVKIPEKILSTPPHHAKVNEIKAGKHRTLIASMRKDMVDAKGVGLAANQVGQPIALFVIDRSLASENGVPDAYFNPEITEMSREQDETEEGCLSIPGWYAPIRRAKKIKIKAVDEHGNKIKFKARGFLARVLQHETDHLHGITIKDWVSPKASRR